ncbi:MAG: putative L-lysine-epsilon aminotransferase [Verrucomicrobiota bacterium]|jgi:L-lysine 6-transaminase
MSLPGPKSQAMLEELSRYVIAEPWPFTVDLERSHGMYLVTADGEELFDWGGYYGAKLLTHNHPGLYEPGYVRRLVRAANNKLANPDFLTAECLEFYRLIHGLAPDCMKRAGKVEVYAVNSGAEAVENMMKYLLNLHDQRSLKKGRIPGARRFIYFDQAFHGRTVFALGVTQLGHDPMITKNFRGIVPGNLQVPFPALDSDLSEAENLERSRRCLEIVEDCLRRHPGEIAGIILEPLQGAGGHRLAPKEFYQELSRLAHEHETCLGFDEVQTAGGQCGSVFACDLLDLPHPPQAIAVAKKFGTGAVYMLHSMDDVGILDSTWGGPLVDMVRIVREFEIIREEKLMESLPERAGKLLTGLQELQRRHPGTLRNIRGWGLYLGFSFASPAMKNRFLDRMLEEESTFLLGAGPDNVRLRPPLDVDLASIELLLAKMERLLSQGI